MPLIRTLLQSLHHGSQARLPAQPGTFPDVLVDRGNGLLRFQVGKPRKPSTNHVVPAQIHKGMYASVVIGASCDTAPTSGNTDSAWSWRQKLR
jgi:hypothetical protein